MSAQFCGVGLVNPKNHYNVGHALRAAGCFDASFVAFTGQRYRRAGTDTHATHKKLPLIRFDDIRRAVPYDCVPVAIELIPGATLLHRYQHPRRAFYIFGAEDSTLGQEITSWCRDVVVIPGGCLNLAAAVNVVLYDRTAKLLRDGLEDVPGAQTRRVHLGVVP